MAAPRLLTLSLGGFILVGDGVSNHSVYGRALNPKPFRNQGRKNPDRCSSRTFRQRAS